MARRRFEGRGDRLGGSGRRSLLRGRGVSGWGEEERDTKEGRKETYIL